MKNMAEDRGFVLEVDEEGGMTLAPARTEAANKGDLAWRTTPAGAQRGRTRAKHGNFDAPLEQRPKNLS